jgi:presenilin-like A22 family membrane protease
MIRTNENTLRFQVVVALPSFMLVLIKGSRRWSCLRKIYCLVINYVECRILESVRWLLCIRDTNIRNDTFKNIVLKYFR